VSDALSDDRPSRPLPLGKLPVELLESLLSRTSIRDERVLLGPGVGVDCAVIAIGDKALALKSDPITFTSDEIGWYAVQVNANDIATTGAEPRWMLATLLLPEGDATADLVEHIQAQLNAACQEINVSIVGGHTEITYGLDRPIVVGSMIGEIDRDHLITPRGARPGDQLLLTKGVPIEAASILARDFANQLQANDPALSQEDIQAARDYLYHPGISVLKDAKIAIQAGEVHAMHDPTEGGLYAAAWELSMACGCSLWIDPDLVHVPPLAERLCVAMGIDPLGAIASGALLMAIQKEDQHKISTALSEQGINSAVIGEIQEESSAPVVRQGPEPGAPHLPKVARDEIARLYETY
jgi:hydrogenase maturation factor